MKKFVIRTWAKGSTYYNNTSSTFSVIAPDLLKAFTKAAKFHVKEYGEPPFKIEEVYENQL